MAPEPPKPPYDQRLANEAAAVDQCIKLGGVILPKSKPTTGFNTGFKPKET